MQIEAPGSVPLLLGRDLDAARDAYSRGDAESSRVAHSVQRPVASQENHAQPGGALKTLVFGGLDGTLTSFAIIAGAAGARLGPVAVLAIGISTLVADGLAMGIGEFLSSRSYSSYVRQEFEREKWELENFPEGEVMEMIDLFVQRGMERADAQVVIMRMAKYKQFFLNIMMMEELCLPVPAALDDNQNITEGLAMFSSFTFFGILPVLAYALVPTSFKDLGEQALFCLCGGGTFCALVSLGALKGQFTDKRYLRSGIETAFLGIICASVAFFVGRLIADLFATTELAAWFESPETRVEMLTQQLADAKAMVSRGGAAGNNH